jgi:hypothetical protein
MWLRSNVTLQPSLRNSQDDARTRRIMADHTTFWHRAAISNVATTGSYRRQNQAAPEFPLVATTSSITYAGNDPAKSAFRTYDTNGPDH